MFPWFVPLPASDTSVKSTRVPVLRPAAVAVLVALAGQGAHAADRQPVDAGTLALPSQLAQATKPPARPPRAVQQPVTPGTTMPAQELTEQILYEFLIAEIAGQRGNVGLAAQAYADLAKRTRDPRIARRATEISLFARMPEAAIESARVWYEVEPGATRALQTLASMLLSTGRLDEAFPYVEKLIAESPQGPGEAFLLLQRSLAGARDKAAALRFMLRLAEKHPSLAQAHYAVSQTAAAADQIDQALAAVRRARTLQPDWEAAVLLEAQLLQRKSNADALGLLSGFLNQYPNAREVRLNLARTLVAEKRYAEARVEFQRLLEIFPKNTEVVFAVALLSMQLNDFALAEGSFKRLLDLGYADEGTVRLYLGQIAEDRKDWEAALAQYRQVTQGEQALSAQIRIAQVYARQGNLSVAREHIQKLEASSTQQRVQLILAEAQMLREAKQEKVAFDVLERGLDRLPNNPDLLYDYAMLAERIDRMDLLESSLRKVIELRPEHAHAYNALGYSLADRNQRLPEARELIERALKLAPDDYFIVDSMGWVLYRLGLNREALVHLRRAYAGRPDAEIAAHLGEVLWVDGQREEAERVWGEALKKYPEHDVLNSTVKRLKR
jgi:tetratricopeptide (TPR) repeat protein